VASTPLLQHHVLEYPGGYTRSTGPVVGRYLTGLRAGRIQGVRLASGRVVVPPLEYDPDTAAAVSVDDFVDVGPAGVVTAWTWVAEPRAGKHPLAYPFAFALVRPDGADTAMVHVVDAGSPEGMAIGMRVAPRWRAERVGHVTDIDAWVPLADGEQPAPAPPLAEEPEDDVTGIVSPIRLDYEVNAGQALGRYLRGLAAGKVIGARAKDGSGVYVPPRGSDPITGQQTDIEVEVKDTGTVTTFCVVNIPGLSALAPEVPYVCAQILLDGAHTPWFGLIKGIDWQEVRMGLRVKAKWADEQRFDASAIEWFEPTGEPDVAYETFKEYA
jgi:uncharacterized OB-fold protein